jgi:hypothetical protein
VARPASDRVLPFGGQERWAVRRRPHRQIISAQHLVIILSSGGGSRVISRCNSAETCRGSGETSGVCSPLSGSLRPVRHLAPHAYLSSHTSSIRRPL